MEKILFEKISRAHIFMGMSAEKIEAFFKTSNFKIRKYTKGNTIALRGDIYTDFMVLIEGTAIGEMVDPSGNAIEVEIIKSPRPLAPAFLFGKNNRLPVDVIAKENCTVLVISKNSVIKLLQSDISTLTHYLDIISSRAQFLSEKLHLMTFKTIKEKFVYYILKNNSDNRNEIIINKSHQELSEVFGVTRPALSRIISELERDNIILFKKKKITIINYKKLNDILS